MCDNKYVQFGCGLSAPKDWENYDISPTLRVQKIPLLGGLFKKVKKTNFPKNVKYGNIIKGLPIPNNSCKGLYSSHTLEHLSLNDFRIALKNSYSLLQKGGIFRCIVPDLESMARDYVASLDKGDADSSVKFIKNTLMGVETRNKGIKSLLINSFGNAHHLWMWDELSMKKELEEAGFTHIRRCQFNDSQDEMFKQVEDEDRFIRAVAIECFK